MPAAPAQRLAHLARIGCESIARQGVCDAVPRRARVPSTRGPTAPPGRSGWPNATSTPDTPTAWRRCVRTPPRPRVRRPRGRDARPRARWRHTRSRAQALSRIATSRSVSSSSWSANRPSGRPSDTGARIPKTSVALRSSLRRRDSRRIRCDGGASGSAAPPSLTDTTATSTPDAASCAVIAPSPSVSSSGCGATTIRPGHSVRSSAGSVSGINHSRTGVPPPDSGVAANRAPLPPVKRNPPPPLSCRRVD